MEYTELTFSVPKGYEQQVIDLVNRKLEAIVTQIKLKPTPEAIEAVKTEMEEMRKTGKLRNASTDEEIIPPSRAILSDIDLNPERGPQV